MIHILTLQKRKNKTQSRVQLFLCKNKNCPEILVTTAADITVNKQPDTKLNSAKTSCAYSKWAHMPWDWQEVRQGKYTKHKTQQNIKEFLDTCVGKMAEVTISRIKLLILMGLVAGSIPDGVTGIFQWLNPSGRIVALGSTQPLTDMSTRNPFWG
jgi:hypothetical protein